MSGRRALDSGYRIEIDRIACDAYGTCAELLPEGIDLDEWGYPILAPGNVPAHLLDLAKRAVDGCPVLALRLVKAVGDPVAAVPPAPVFASRRPEVRPDRMEGTPPWPPRPANRPAKRGPDQRRRR
ncbi:MAG TPA: ferredoxin [Candidatus Limnocylindrales bacterium]